VLTGLAPHLPADQQPAVLAQALTATAIATDSARAEALTRLAPHLPADLLAQALTAATAIADDDLRAGVLTGLAPHLPADLLAQAVKAAPKTGIEPQTALLQRGRSVFPRDQDAMYVDLLRESITGTERSVCFMLLTAAAPAVAEIGGVRTIEQCVNAVSDVHRWWP
jgi:hypothetical protein